MPRASRHFLPGHVWHITHRCHQKAFLLQFAHDRQCYLRWLFEAKKRFGLCVLNYMVTSNHIHLLVKDTGADVIAQSMQLVAGRTAQAFNQRKHRKGAFWQDRYHATAIETNEHLRRCLVYIDLNMVRAGVVRHPAQWAHGGYREIQSPPKRYAIIDVAELSALCGFANITVFREAHRGWVQSTLAEARAARDERWSAALAVGSKAYVEQIRSGLGIRALHRRVSETDGVYILREPDSLIHSLRSPKMAFYGWKMPFSGTITPKQQ
ncbi:MAG: transposase [Burkholderiales bacterium]